MVKMGEAGVYLILGDESPTSILKKYQRTDVGKIERMKTPIRGLNLKSFIAYFMHFAAFVIKCRLCNKMCDHFHNIKPTPANTSEWYFLNQNKVRRQ